MIKVNDKNAVTLIALVITIVIMLLLAAIVIQMAIGENGLVVKTIQAKKEQAKAELYDTAKLSYANLKLKALENGQPEPQAELALSTIEFRDKYDIVGDDITDKKGEKIDTKENVLKIITGTIPSGSTHSTSPGGTTTPSETWPKTVAGVTIQEEDKDKTIIKINVLGPKAKVQFYGNLKIDYGEGVKGPNINEIVEFSTGEHIIKIHEYHTSAGINELGER